MTLQIENCASIDLAGEEGQGDGFAHSLVAGRRWMKVVAAIVGGQKAVGVVRIADELIEVDDGVEVAGSANPGVDGLAIGFAQGAGVVVVGADVGRDGGAIDAEAGAHARG